MVIKTHLTQQVFCLEAAFDHSGLCYKDNEFIFNVSNLVYRKFFQYFNKVDLFYRGYLKPVFKLLMTNIGIEKKLAMFTVSISNVYLYSIL